MAKITNERIVGMSRGDKGMNSPESITRPRYDLTEDEKRKPFADELCVKGMVFTISDDGQDLVILSSKRLNKAGKIENREYRFILADSEDHIVDLDPGRYINTSNAAKHMGVHASTLARWKAAGMLLPVFEGPSVQGAFRTRYYDIKDCDRIIFHYNNGTGPFSDSVRYQPGQRDVAPDGSHRTIRADVRTVSQGSLGDEPPIPHLDKISNIQDSGVIRKPGEDTRGRSKIATRAKERADNPISGNPIFKKRGICDRRKHTRSALMRTTISTKKFAKIFQCSYSTIITRHHAGLLPFGPVESPIPVKGFRWPKEKVMAWAKEYGLA